MIKILFLTERLREGGAEKVLRTLVNSMDQSKFRITLQTVEYQDPGQLLSPGIRYKAMNRCKTRLGKRLYSFWLRFCAETGLIYPMYIREDYDIEAAFLECGPTKFLSQSTNRHALKLAWVHCDLEKKGILPTGKLRRMYSRYDRVICVSEDVKSTFLKLFGNNPEACVLHNVIDEEEIREKASAPLADESPVFTFAAVGRLVHQKGFDRLLEACRMLKEEHRDFRLQILGEGPERDSLSEQISRLGLSDTVSLLGFQDNPYPYMKAADCIVCSSRYEGYSTVIAEALILGKPIVSTRCTAMEELLGSSEWGILTDHSAVGIYQGMKTLLGSPEALCRLSNAAETRGRDFSKEKAVSHVQQFLLEEWSRKHSQIKP